MTSLTRQYTCTVYMYIKSELKEKETKIQSKISQNRKEKSWNCYQWMIAYFIFLSYGTVVVDIGVRDGCTAIKFVKHVKTVFIQVLSCSTQCSADAWIVALLWKFPQIPSCQRKQRQLGQKQFWHVFTKLIAVQPSMANYEWTMNQIKVE